MIPFYLISGFLGSGKTTFLKNLLTQGSANKKIAVIQNEFAPAGIDGIVLKQIKSDFELIEINNGSVFCSCLLGSFIQTLKKIVHNYQPTEIYLEASGLADPSNISQIFDEKELQQQIYLAGTICIVDAINYSKVLHKLPRVAHQIRFADTIFINKTDMVDNEEVKTITEHINKLNPFAKIHNTSYCKLPDQFTFKNQKENKRDALFFVNPIGSDRPNMNSTVLKTVKKIDSNNLNELLNDLNKISIRSKGFINLNNQQTVLFQSVFNTSTIIKYNDYPGNTEFIVIGEDVSLKMVEDIYGKYSV